jgi:hypothetical protein
MLIPDRRATHVPSVSACAFVDRTFKHTRARTHTHTHTHTHTRISIAEYLTDGRHRIVADLAAPDCKLKREAEDGDPCSYLECRAAFLRRIDDVLYSD